MTRPYDMTVRGRQAARTADRILDATRALLEERPLADVTLPAIADRAGVAVRTVLRHHGSREGCLAATAERVGADIRARRDASPAGDVTAAVRDLIDHYEQDGPLVLRLLSQEPGDEAYARAAAAEGRTYHRAWVERCFGPLLPPAPASPPSTADPSERETLVDALVAATDLYVWKLLRRDLGRSREATSSTVERTVRALLEAT